MPTFRPNEDSVISLDMGLDFSGVDDSNSETFQHTWAKNGKASASITMTAMPTTEQLINDWLAPPILAVLLPKGGVLAKIAQLLHRIPITWLRNRLEPHAYDVIEIADMRKGDAYQDAGGNWVIPFHKP